MPNPTPFCAVIVAAGSGTRAGGAKQWKPLAGRPVVRWSVEALLEAGAAPVVVVGPAGDQDRADAALKGLDRYLDDRRDDLRDRFRNEAPWWLPGAVEDRIFERLLDGVIAKGEALGRRDSLYLHQVMPRPH